MRLFIAIELPTLQRKALSRIQKGIPGTRWTPETNMHITLRFLGNVDGGQAEDIAYELQRIDMSSFEVMATGAGQFSGGSGIRSLWVGLAPQESLLDLQSKVERACRRAGLKPERQTYCPHITIARFNNPPDPEIVRRFLEGYAEFKCEPFRVSGFSLFSSELRRSAALYRIEADFPFSDAGIGESPFFDDWDDTQIPKRIRAK